MQFTISLPKKPKWFVRFQQKGKEVSDWIDDTFFPLDDAGTRLAMTRRQAELMAEQDANKIRARIAACTSLEQAYSIRPVLDRYRVMYGNTAQIKAAEGSLRLELFHRENDIIEAL